MCSIKTEHIYYADTPLLIKVSMSVNKSNTHSLRSALHTCWHTAALLPAGSASCPKPGLKLLVFLRVSVKCIHMLLRGLRLEGDCFPSDKNHLAPSEEPASQHRTAQNRTAHRSAAPLWHSFSVHRQERRTSHTWVWSNIRALLLNRRVNRFHTLFSEGKRVNTGNK